MHRREPPRAQSLNHKTRLLVVCMYVRTCMQADAHIYTHACTYAHVSERTTPAGVCENNTPPERKILGNISLKDTKSGAGEEFMLQDCRARACSKGVFFHRHGYLFHVASVYKDSGLPTHTE